MGRKRAEQTIVFPWERRGGWLRLPWQRSRAVRAGVVAAAVLTLFAVGERDRTGRRATRASMLVVAEAVDAWRADHDGSCPPSLAALRDGGYLAVAPVDAWGRPFDLRCPGRRHPDSYDLASYGPSGEPHALDRIE
jgi:general secretion pathway protein G